MVLWTHPESTALSCRTSDALAIQLPSSSLCERLSANDINKALIKSFVSKRGASLVSYFQKLQDLVGCEYAFLFAADLSEDESLVNYYDVSLKFKKRLDVGTNKPFYDFCCDFMCQEVNDMKKNRELFFENFNIDEEDIIA